jgi:SAM-dependent methyltransferase
MKIYERSREKALCPVCCTEEADLLWRVSSNQAAQHFVLYEKNPERFAELVLHIDKLWGQSTCKVMQCAQCRFCFSYPYVAGDEHFYSLAYVRSGYPKWKWEFQVTYDVLRRNLHSSGKLIEIGAGDGAFISKIAKEVLAKENIFCTEFSEYGRHQIESLGIKCVPKDIRELSGQEYEKCADVICLFQVLEHMDGLDVLFEKLNWLLKPGGSIFIAVPNQNMIEFNELNGALLDMPPNHIGRWNRRCFEIIGNKHKLTLVNYQVENSDLALMARQFINYRFLRNCQNGESLSNKLRMIGINSYIDKTAQALGVAVNAVMAAPALLSLIKDKSNLGNSQWVHFVGK